MARIPVYKNSILASLLSIIAYLFMAGGFAAAFGGEILAGIGAFLVGMFFAFLGSFLSAWKQSRAARKRRARFGQ